MKFSIIIIILSFSIFTSNLVINQFTEFLTTYAAYAIEELTPENTEEIRENLLEVRLALQKGDLIEALQHLNNVDEELLLLSSNISNLGK